MNSSAATTINPFSILKSIYTRRDLLLQITRRQIEQEYKGSYLGMAWTVVEPLATMSMYAMVFGLFLGARFAVPAHETGLEYALALFLGLALFNLVAEVLGRAPGSITSVPNYVKKIVFPLELLPLAVALTSATRFVVAVVLLLGAMLLVGVPLTWWSLLMPVIALPIFLLAVGFAWLLAAAGVFIRDVGKVMRLITLGLLYSSAIFFSPNLISEKSAELWSVLQWNPLLLAVDMGRRSLLWGDQVDFSALVYLYVVGVIMFMLGYRVFTAARPVFSDVIR